ncbi:MAG: putative Ig domain-containing protein, partial [Oligoflexia bacterium]|nr:putative Ig domain-containing protein [Oligoflexia bacterium]
MKKIFMLMLLLLFLPIVSGCHYLDEDKGGSNPSTTTEDGNNNSSNTNTTTESGGTPNGNVDPPSPPLGGNLTETPVPISTPVATPTPEIEVVSEPIKFHYPKDRYDFYHGTKIDEVKAIIENGTIDKFVIGKESYLPLGITLNTKTGAITGTPIKIGSGKERKITIWAYDKSEKVKEKIEITISIKELRAMDIIAQNDYVCLIANEKEERSDLGILCWGNLSIIG